MPVVVSGEVIDRREIAPFELLEIDIDTAELPRILAAVTVTRESTTPLFLAGEANAVGVRAMDIASPQHAANSEHRASNFLTLGYY